MYVKRPSLLIAMLLLISMLSILFALLTGSASVSWQAVIDALVGNATENIHTLIIELRLPRALSAFALAVFWRSPAC